MFLKQLITAVAVLATASVTSAEVITLNSTKATTLYDGGSEIYYLSAWSYTGGAADSNKTNSYKSWITFDNSSILAPYVTDAKLTLKQWSDGALVITTPITIELYALTDSAGDNWAAEVNWSNAPANVVASSKLLDPTKTVLAGTYTFTGQFPARSQVIQIPFTPAGVSFLNADTDGLSTFILVARDDSTSFTGFHAYTNSPTLIATVPEPTALFSLGSVSLALLFRKRKLNELA